MCNPLISVIVPVYMVEQYLSRCVDSILAQTYTNLEIFLVDDGSRDNCGKICDEYAEKDSRIIVIHKENGGLSDARNVAIDVMNGEYVTFIDSDDFVSPYYVENLYCALHDTGADMSASWHKNYYDGDRVPDFSQNVCGSAVKLTSAEFLERMLYQDRVETCAWGKLYKSELFDGVRYPVGKLYEDLPTTYKTVDKSEYIAVIPNEDYMYFQRRESIQNMNFNPKKMAAEVHMNELRDFINANYPALSKAADCRYMSMACNIIFQIPKDEFPDEWSKLWNGIKSVRKTVLFDGKAVKKARFAALLSYFGFTILSTVYFLHS